MRLFMKGVLACLFLLGVAVCALCVWPAALIIWQGKILLDAAGLESLAAIVPVFLMGVATCTGAAIGVAQLDMAEGRESNSTVPPRQKATAAHPSAAASASSLAESASAAQTGSPTASRRTVPNPLK